MKCSFKHAVIVAITLLSQPLFSEMVPFVIPADVHPDSQIAMEWQPLTEQDRLSARTHFVNQRGQRVRLWGVNLSFEANFPTHADAERIAKRMAAFGVNTVRFHHMDTSPWPRGIWDTDGTTLHPEALDRLDYFIDTLAKHGIYTNLNLHVGKKHSVTLGLPETPTDYDKMVNIFTPELVEAQKDYARSLLTHKNPYRDNKTYADDYAIAIVEITNENSLFMWNAEITLRTLPAYYADILQKQYNQWLKGKYPAHAALVQNWTKDSVPAGDNLLKNATLTDANLKTQSWHLEQHAGCRASTEIAEFQGRPALRIHSLQNDGTDWHLQFNQRELKLTAGQVYTVEFDAATPLSRPINVGVQQAHEPWQNLGLHQPFTLDTHWKTFRTNFTATDDDDNARLSFAFGGDGREFCLANVKLYPGATYELSPDESLDRQTILLFGETESPQRKTDRMVFLAETEKAYFDGMKSFIQKDLGCKGMVTGTIVFGPLGLYAQSDMDFVDSHAYWQHPQFPNRPWDPGDWLIEQKAMSDNPPGTLYELAAERLSGKPFTVTEYNHPAPLDSQAECVPMIASFAAAQDWDGVWLYTYSHSNGNWDREHLNSFFDIDTNPAKWGFMPAGAKVFRDEYLKPLRELPQGAAGITASNIEPLAAIHLKADRNMLEAIESGLPQETVRQGGRLSSKARLEWNGVDSNGLYLVKNDACTVLTGRTERFSGTQNGLSVKLSGPDFASVMIVAADGKPLDESRRILITACGRCENTDMQFSDDRRTVGRNWGTAPVRIEPVEGQITLPSSGKWTCKPLNADGTVQKEIACPDGVELKADYGTMWYLVERLPD